jgi:AcrR family transcriptional regulator
MSDPPQEPRHFDGKLPRGRHKLSREHVAESQRWRLIRASGESLMASGYGGLTTRDVSRRAGVSSATFYLHFEDADACLLAAHAVAADCLGELVGAACTGTGAWPERLHAALGAATDFLASEPALARLLGADLAAAVPAVAAARERLLARLAGLLCSGRQLRLRTADRLPPLAETHLTGAVAGLFGDRIAAGELAVLPALVPELTDILAAPYRDAADAVSPR